MEATANAHFSGLRLDETGQLPLVESVHKQPFVIGVAGGTASGKTTVCDMIIQQLHDHRVVLVNQDSFYRGLTPEELAHVQEYNFDHPGVPKQNHKSKKPSREAAVAAQSRSPIVVEVREGEPLSGMRKWLAEYHSKRPGLHVLQQQIDSFIADFEDQEEQARQEQESIAAEEGWTVVIHQKGRKKTTDAEGAISVGGVSAAAVDRKRKKQNTDTALNFYRFQRRESCRNEIMELQQRFEEDKKRFAALRAARKFRPY